MKTKNQILLQKRLINLVNSGQKNIPEAMSIQRELMSYGYMLDQEAWENLASADMADIIDFRNEVVSFLQEMLGGKHNYESLYKNFPNDVMSMNDAELYINQVIHYILHNHFTPVGLPKEKAFEQVDYKIISFGTQDKLQKVFTNLITSGQSLTPMDVDVLKWFAGSGLSLKYPDTIPFKENLVVLVDTLPNLKLNTVIDVLRVATGYSGGDVSLPPLPKGKHKKVVERRIEMRYSLTKEQKDRIMDLFESSNLSLQDMNQGSRYGKFIRLAEVIGLRDYYKSHPLTYAAFNSLRNQKRKGKPDGKPKIITWNSRVRNAFENFGLKRGLELLKERPTEYLRRLDALLRNNPNEVDTILGNLNSVALGASNKAIYELMNHFENRSALTQRKIFIKGARKAKVIKSLPVMNSDLISRVQSTLLHSLGAKFSQMGKLGNVYVDPELKKIPLPTNMRSLNDSLTPIIRGQRVPMNIKKAYLRSFIHWYDERGNEDLDLHGYLLGDKGAADFGYNGAHRAEFGVFSGDVRHRRGACAEYVDINIEKAIKAGFNYYLMVVHNFTGKPLNTLKDCVVGFMERDSAHANMSWLPDTISTCTKMSSGATYALVGAYDLRTLEYIHLDLDWNSVKTASRSSSNALMKAVESYLKEPNLSVWHLLRLHAENRGVITSMDQANTHFMYDDFSKDYTNILPFLGV
jgi:hypothetical protein